jgi:signal transduction histidine kinase
MTIRNRLLFSSIVMLLVPIALILLTGGVIREIYDPVQEYAELPGDFYRELYATMAGDPEALLEQTYLEELESLTEYEGRINIYVFRERAEVNRLENIVLGTNDRGRYPMLVFTDWDFRYSDGVPGEVSLFVSDSQRIYGAYVTTGFIILVAVVILVLSNGLLSWRISRSITKPLRILEDAAHQIKEEDLETPVIYHAKDEYQQVCRAFEEMRIRLKDSLLRQLKYEENRKELLSNISHDLKTPITAIKGYIEGIRDGVADTEEKKDKYLATIYHKSMAMNDLIDRLFLFSKLDLGKMPFHFERMDIGAFLVGSCDELRLDYPRLAIHFDEPEQEIFVEADVTQLRRVITNIVDNADKYCENETPRVAISVQRDGLTLELSIRDNGPGVAGDVLPRIFDSFVRGDASRTASSEGSGIGLSIAREIVRAHGGSILARNVQGGGFEVLCTLRLADEEDTHH